MFRVFLAAGVAALAIAAPANAGPHGQHGGNGGQPAIQMRSGGGQAHQRVQFNGGGRSFAAPRMPRQQSFASVQRAQRQARPQRLPQSRMVDRQQARPLRMERQARVAEHHQARPQRIERTTRLAQRQQARPQRMERAQTRMAQRQQARPQRIERAQNGVAMSSTSSVVARNPRRQPNGHARAVAA